jgi:hypothetical protein
MPLTVITVFGMVYPAGQTVDRMETKASAVKNCREASLAGVWQRVSEPAFDTLYDLQMLHLKLS